MTSHRHRLVRVHQGPQEGGGDRQPLLWALEFKEPPRILTGVPEIGAQGHLTRVPPCSLRVLILPQDDSWGPLCRRPPHVPPPPLALLCGGQDRARSWACLSFLPSSCSGGTLHPQPSHRLCTLRAQGQPFIELSLNHPPAIGPVSSFSPELGGWGFAGSAQVGAPKLAQPAPLSGQLGD